MRRLSTPIERISDHYELVVVGSGYGGAIAAARLSVAGRHVAVLERGLELQPGEFPRTMLEALRSSQVSTPSRHLGPATGLFDFRLGRDISVLVGCGLGGTSLINSNVALASGPEVFDDERWPKALRGDGATVLEPYYAMAREMLGTNPYPSGATAPRKFEALRRSADALGARAEHVPLNVTFARGSNAAGVVQNACVMCGNCATGCNYGAKNTTVMNYLPTAADAGAEIFTGACVRTVVRSHDRWVVSFEELGSGRGRFRAPTMFVTADAVVLAAGSLGSTEILLRSRDAGLRLSDRLGQRFTGNGDVLAFAYDTEDRVQGVGLGRRFPGPGSDVGPTITGMVELTDRRGRPMLMEEGAVPGPLAPLVNATLFLSGLTAGRDAGIRARLAKQALAAPLGPYRGPMDRTLTYLFMSADDDVGEMRLDRDRLRISWHGEPSGASVRDANEHAGAAARGLGGTFLRDPTSGPPFGHAPATVHPLGGCVMADGARFGVVDDVGRVFDAPNGSSSHPGLYVLDGSIVPRPLGVNPLLTICALAERACQAIVAEGTRGSNGQRRTSRAAPPDSGAAVAAVPAMHAVPAVPAVPGREAAPLPGLVFTERMSGAFSTRAAAMVGTEAAAGPDGLETGPLRQRRCEAAAALGGLDGTGIEFVLTISFDDLNAVLRDASHPGRLSGTVTVPALAARRLVVTDGTFRLFAPDPIRAGDGSTLMRYTMMLRGEDGAALHFDGFKVLGRRSMLRTWPDTTTLYATVRDAAGRIGSPEEFDGAIRGMGVLRISPWDLGKQLLTVRATNVDGGRLSSRYRNAFTRMFSGTLWRMYGRMRDERPPGAGRP